MVEKNPPSYSQVGQLRQELTQNNIKFVCNFKKILLCMITNYIILRPIPVAFNKINYRYDKIFCNNNDECFGI